MRYVEKVAKTVDGAVTEALIELGATTDQVDIEVIDKGSKGIFGFGAKNARVKVIVREDENLDDLGLEKLSTAIDLKAALNTGINEESEKIRVEKQQKAPSDKNKVAEVPTKPIKQEKNKQEYEQKHEQDKQETIQPKTQEVKEKSNKDFSATISKIETFLITMLKEMEIEATVQSSVVKDKVKINIETEQASKIIGKRGDTLDALQYICNIVANKEQEGYIKITLDTANYRQKREETLKRLAYKLAKKASTTKKSVTLEPMNPYDRRIIHAALQHNKYVKTHSEGKEPYRKVVISPYYTSKNTNK